MTSPAILRKSDLQRMAEVAKKVGVTFWLDMGDGRRIGISPNAEPVDTAEANPEDFRSFEEYEAWRDANRAGQA